MMAEYAELLRSSMPNPFSSEGYTWLMAQKKRGFFGFLRDSQ
jgi:hypothetical protein